MQTSICLVRHPLFVNEIPVGVDRNLYRCQGSMKHLVSRVCFVSTSALPFRLAWARHCSHEGSGLTVQATEGRLSPKVLQKRTRWLQTRRKGFDRKCLVRMTPMVNGASMMAPVELPESSLRTDRDQFVVEKTSTFEVKQGTTLSVNVSSEMGFYQVEFRLPEEDMILHWGIDNWLIPDSSWWPTGSIEVNESKAIETRFTFVCCDHWQVLMKLPQHEAPRCLNFVLRDKHGNWHNNGGCFTVMLKPLDIDGVLGQIILAETTNDNWSLFNRFILASELLDSAEAVGADGMSLIYTWLRFSANKQLAWYRNCNYQSKDIASVQERLATLMTEKAKSGKTAAVRRFARMTMAILPRGGGDSEQIRMGILNIMREHGIKEGHRPGIEEHFLEQWHQKLHSNTSPEDIHICEAYLEFLHTNSMDAFYRTLWEKGSISQEWLEKMDHPINATPLHLPHLIPAFKHFLWVLKTVHSGADLDVALEMSKNFLGDDLKGTLYHILCNRNTWWIPGKVVEARKQLEGLWRANWTSRDVLLLDIALDNFFSLSIARIDKSSLSGDDLCNLIRLILESVCLESDSNELNMCLKYWSQIVEGERWTKDWVILALAGVERISTTLQGYMDEIYQLVQPQSEALGKACGVPEAFVRNFGEEVVRGQPLFNLSILLQKLQPILRRATGLGSWQVCAQKACLNISLSD